MLGGFNGAAFNLLSFNAAYVARSVSVTDYFADPSAGTLIPGSDAGLFEVDPSAGTLIPGSDAGLREVDADSGTLIII